MNKVKEFKIRFKLFTIQLIFYIVGIIMFLYGYIVVAAICCVVAGVAVTTLVVRHDRLWFKEMDDKIVHDVWNKHTS